jgi:hypothetical protein
VAEPGLLIGTEPDLAKYRVGEAPVVVVDPHPDNADNHVRDEDGGEPDDPQEARKWRSCKKAQRQQKAAEHIDESSDNGENRRVAYCLEERIVTHERREVADADELDDSVRFDGVEAVEDRAQHGIHGKAEIEQQGWRQEHQQQLGPYASGAFLAASPGPNLPGPSLGGWLVSRIDCHCSD